MAEQQIFQRAQHILDTCEHRQPSPAHLAVHIIRRHQKRAHIPVIAQIHHTEMCDHPEDLPKVSVLLLLRGQLRQEENQAHCDIINRQRLIRSKSDKQQNARRKCPKQIRYGSGADSGHQKRRCNQQQHCKRHLRLLQGKINLITPDVGRCIKEQENPVPAFLFPRTLINAERQEIGSQPEKQKEQYPAFYDLMCAKPQKALEPRQLPPSDRKPSQTASRVID